VLTFGKLVALTSMAAMLPGYSDQDRYLHTDSLRPYLTETTHVFHCEDIRAALTLEEHHRSDDQALDLVDRWRITMTSFSVSGRTIPADEMRRLGERLHLFAWVERVQAHCVRYNRVLTIEVRGMLADAWASVSEGRVQERPQPVTVEIIVAENGSLTIM
jgi:hypothetical protein